MYVVLKKQNNPVQMTTKHKNKQTNPKQQKNKQSKIQKKNQTPKKDGISKHEKMNFCTQAKKEWKTQSTNYMPKQAFFLGKKIIIDGHCRLITQLKQQGDKGMLWLSRGWAMTAGAQGPHQL